MDRIYGLVSLMFLCILSICIFFIFIGAPHVQIMSLSVVIILVGLALCLFFVPFKLSFNLSKSTAFFPSLLNKFIIFSQELRDSLSHQKFLSTLLLIATSFIAHGVVILQAYLVGYRLNPEQVTLLICILAIPPAIFVSYMPFSIAGWGLREASMVMAFGLVKVDPSTAIIVSITIGMAIFITSLLGGILWAVDLRKKAY